VANPSPSADGAEVGSAHTYAQLAQKAEQDTHVALSKARSASIPKLRTTAQAKSRAAAPASPTRAAPTSTHTQAAAV
jgi:hypothetical protein